MDIQLTKETIAQLEKCNDLPSPPGVAEQIIQLSSKVNCDMETLAKTVSFDPALSAKILRMANSAMYARRNKVENIQQAVVLFGWNGTLNLALSFSLIGNGNKNAASGLDYDYFWRRCLASAVPSKKLGEAIGYPRKEELFLPALLQDIGMLVIDKIQPSIYKNLTNQRFLI